VEIQRNFGTEHTRLGQLLGYLDSDPDNLRLLDDAANAALDVSELETALELADRYAAIAQPPPSLRNVVGIVAMRLGRLDEARAAFEALRAEGHDQPGVHFNLAWVAALEGRYEDVLDLTDEAVVIAVPRAAALRVQAFHHLDRIDDALAAGQAMLEIHPEDDALLGALSVAAMDADDYDLAAQYAGRAKGGADALTTQGLVRLNDDDMAGAVSLFDRALAEHPNAPRAWLGKGLSLLARGDADAAAPCLEKGAEIFGDHLGSWIAVGWTHFVRKDFAAARRSFYTAMAHDENFAETHGGLAVLDIVENKIESARRRTEIALRLDKECFGGILARTLLLEMDGKPELAAKIRERAMNMSVGIDGKTLAQAMIGINASGGNAPSTSTLQ
jgi:tetratricopeptide (TPR) repeat protein